ncbi:OmpP1/FadL family transporter [Pseudotabrizicola sp. L79]|uniref:OmpP1/FadL family transporter n=1 Tax=Pseudotabrizicola sp. L79 TaxID=3118402 RepID=UPI002F94AA9E
MRNTFAAVSALALAAGSAHAGGVERTTQSIAIIFETGNYAELTFGSVTPKVSGVGAGTVPSPLQPTPGVPSGDMAADYTQLSFGVKTQINDSLDIGLVIDQPFGADVSYPLTGYYASGSVAELNSTAITGIARYKLPNNVSLLAGLRYQTLEATASIPFIGGYTVNGEKDGGVGYLVGIAYEKPEIALRVALTYNSSIKHKLATTEIGGLTSTTPIETPQSVNLEFQSGVAKDTLVFGSIRWVEWSKFVIDPANYPPTSALVSYDNNTTTYTLGVGRRFSESWSGAVSLSYEKSNGGFSSNLGPTDGRLGVTIGATYTKDNMKITGGVSYVDIGDAETTLAAASGVPAGEFRNNRAVGVGVRVGFSF